MSFGEIIIKESNLTLKKRDQRMGNCRLLQQYMSVE